MKRFPSTLKRVFSGLAAMIMLLSVLSLSPAVLADGEDVTVLRVCSWEEYIDEGGWDEEEVIDLDSGDIFGKNSLVDDFEDWYYETYGKRVRVEYSTFGTNEDLYNMLTLGDVYDVVCPSEYLIMKLMAEERVQPLSDGFFDEENENNYYTNGVSPFIRNMFQTHFINGESWEKFAAGFMWGVTGFVYNPEVVSREEASTWRLMENTDYARRITVKDNIRDTYFAAVGAVKSDLLLSEEFRNDPDYPARLQDEQNDTSPETVEQIQEYLQANKDNFYSFETDSGKADMVTGKVVANYQWSGDAVYTMDLADEDGVALEFAVPEESTDIWFDGWVMLKCGVEGNAEKQAAAEAFINFVSRPDSAIRNMYYIGYTSVIAAPDDGRILEYLDWNYGAEEDDETAVDYSVAHFFAGEEDDPEDFVLSVPEEQLYRQLGAQYPSEDVLARSCIMVYFTPEVSALTNRMWTNIRCYNIDNMPVWGWIVTVLLLAAIIYVYIRKRSKRV